MQEALLVVNYRINSIRGGGWGIASWSEENLWHSKSYHNIFISKLFTHCHMREVYIISVQQEALHFRCIDMILFIIYTVFYHTLAFSVSKKWKYTSERSKTSSDFKGFRVIMTEMLLFRRIHRIVMWYIPNFVFTPWSCLTLNSPWHHDPRQTWQRMSIIYKAYK